MMTAKRDLYKDPIRAQVCDKLRRKEHPKGP